LRLGTEDVWPTGRRNGLIELGFAQKLKYCPLRNANSVNNREARGRDEGGSKVLVRVWKARRLYVFVKTECNRVVIGMSKIKFVTSEVGGTKEKQGES
jgi:hypothetical protein